MVKIVRGEAKYNFYYIILCVQLFPKSDENACDCLLIILLLMIYTMKQPVKGVLLENALYIEYPLLCSAHFSYCICVICQLDIDHFVFQLDLLSTKRSDSLSLAES